MVVVDGTAITAHDVTLTQNQPWQPESPVDQFLGADGQPLAFKQLTVSGEPVDSSQPGTKNVTYTYTDQYGMTATATIKVTIVASKAAVQAKDVTLMQGQTWTPAAGFISATDTTGQSVALTGVTVTGNVNTDQAGQYTVTYRYQDRYGNSAQQASTVTVLAAQTSLDVTDQTITVSVNATWQPSDNFVSATDAYGNAVSFNAITVTGAEDVNTHQIGTYTVHYRYTDAFGHQVTKPALVHVVATKADIVVKNLTLKVGQTWTAADSFVSATDATGKAVALASVTVTNNVDTSHAGNYQAIYHYTDAAGNLITTIALVTVTGQNSITGGTINKPGTGDHPTTTHDNPHTVKPGTPTATTKPNTSNPTPGNTAQLPVNKPATSGSTFHPNTDDVHQNTVNKPATTLPQNTKKSDNGSTVQSDTDHVNPATTQKPANKPATASPQAAKSSHNGLTVRTTTDHVSQTATDQKPANKPTTASSQATKSSNDGLTVHATTDHVSQNTTDQKPAHNSETTLPQTDERPGNGWTVVGALIISLTSLVSLAGTRRQNK